MAPSGVIHGWECFELPWFGWTSPADTEIPMFDAQNHYREESFIAKIRSDDLSGEGQYLDSYELPGFWTDFAGTYDNWLTAVAPKPDRRAQQQFLFAAYSLDGGQTLYYDIRTWDPTWRTSHNKSLRVSRNGYIGFYKPEASMQTLWSLSQGRDKSTLAEGLSTLLFAPDGQPLRRLFVARTSTQGNGDTYLNSQVAAHEQAPFEAILEVLDLPASATLELLRR
jgi:hypothetical protein